ncbi:hypothetical protein G647_09747 [Cladophialophora carrionii CBS 160.54]|uniref:BHLH domain-containing protein n=1 Tax=Cladophialophora carrionii CBS 160.54 TaxID=1279043 RepID=V9DJM6_9EURO|nr:uncharacterized protein G647_09747 [Cladophialophora carrionii CBS 160.54]ETI27065.1 hypothetical protein G647_09747 [Cladophialophora carrionii CBS 160.54]
MTQLQRTLVASELATCVFGQSWALCKLSESLTKVGKAEIMTSAIDYVNQAELQIRWITHEIETLQNRVLHLQTLLPCE